MTKLELYEITESYDDITPEECDEVLSTCGCFNLRKASRAVTQFYDEILQPTGFRATQLTVLFALGEAQELSLTKLAHMLVVSPSTLSRNLRPLERDGYVEIVNKGKREKSVTLTEDGVAALSEAKPYWSKAQLKFTSLIGDDRWEELSERLDQTVELIRR